MHITLDSHYTLSSDSHGFQINLIGSFDKQGDRIYKPMKYAGTLETALDAWVSQRIKDSAAITLDGLRDDLKKIREELDQIRRNLAIESV